VQPAAPTWAPATGGGQASTCQDDRAWRDVNGYSCQDWDANACRQYRDYGQLENCQVTCGTCPGAPGAPVGIRPTPVPTPPHEVGASHRRRSAIKVNPLPSKEDRIKVEQAAAAADALGVRR